MVAKLLDKLKPDEHPKKARAGNEATDQPHHDFSFDKITALLDHEAPQHRASTGRSLTQLASLGSPTSHADKMSPSMMAQLDGWLIDHYRGCWSYFGLGATQDYIPEVRVQMQQDGSLAAQPKLINPPSDPKPALARRQRDARREPLRPAADPRALQALLQRLARPEDSFRPKGDGVDAPQPPLLPLAGEGGPAKRGRMRGLPAYSPIVA